MTVIRFTVRQHGPHMHVAVRSGSEAQAEAGHLPLAGSLVLTPADWEALRATLDAGRATLTALLAGRDDEQAPGIDIRVEAAATPEGPSFPEPDYRLRDGSLGLAAVDLGALYQLLGTFALPPYGYPAGHPVAVGSGQVDCAPISSELQRHVEAVVVSGLKVETS